MLVAGPVVSLPQARQVNKRSWKRLLEACWSRLYVGEVRLQLEVARCHSGMDVVDLRSSCQVDLSLMPRFSTQRLPVAQRSSPCIRLTNSCPSFAIAAGAINTGNEVCTPRMLVEVSTLDTFRRTRGRKRMRLYAWRLW
jgi:hypothetical protein